MRKLTTAGAIALAMIVSACAQQEEPAVIRGEPTYDKYGSVNGCEDGFIYVPGAAPIDQCLPPDDDCQPTFDATGQQIPCPPPMRDPNDPLGGRDPQTTPQRTPGAAG